MPTITEQTFSKKTGSYLTFLRWQAPLTILVFCILSQISAVTALGQWRYLGLGNYSVGDIKLFNNTIFVSTDNGVYQQAVDAIDTNWIPLGLQEKSIRTILVTAPGEIWAVRNLWQTSDSALVYKTTVGGGDWSVMYHSPVSGSGNPTDNLFDVIDIVPGSRDSLYLIDIGIPAILLTTDGGQSWADIYRSAWRYRFIKINHHRPQQLWFGGEGLIFNPILYMSSDQGMTWQEMPVFSAFQGDNACHTLDLHPDNPECWYVPGEGKVIKTTDAGSTWQVILQNSYYNFDLEISPAASQTVYLVGGRTLFVSRDAGMSWDSLSLPGTRTPLYEWHDLEILHRDGTDLVICGGMTGVYRYDMPVTKIPPNSRPIPSTFKLAQNYPNPFNSVTTFRLTLDHPEYVTLKIIDIRGVEIITLVSDNFSAGTHQIQWDARQLSSGIYFYRAESVSSRQIGKLVFCR